MRKSRCDEHSRFRASKTSGATGALWPRLQLSNRGFTLIELLMVVVILGILAMFAIFAYKRYVYKAEIITAVSDMGAMEKVIYGYTIDNVGVYPPDLAAVEYGGFQDPWGNAYVYQPDLTIVARTQGGTPINTDYDLYSVGSDGFSTPEITTPTSLDDVIRANDGSYKGLSERY